MGKEIRRLEMKSFNGPQTISQNLQTVDKNQVAFFTIHLEDLSVINQKELEKNCQDWSIVLYLKSNVNHESKIVWKLQESEHFIAFHHNREVFLEDDVKIYDFVADFIAESLGSGRLGKFCHLVLVLWLYFFTRPSMVLSTKVPSLQVLLTILIQKSSELKV